jgi:hypothetical protein
MRSVFYCRTLDLHIITNTTSDNSPKHEYKNETTKTAQERIHLKFWHPPGRHDDQLYALALACLATTQAVPPGKGVVLLSHNKNKPNSQFH